MKVFPDLEWEPKQCERWATTPTDALEQLARQGVRGVRIERKYDGRRVYVVRNSNADNVSLWSRNWSRIDPHRVRPELLDELNWIAPSVGSRFVLDCEGMYDDSDGRFDTFYLLDIWTGSMDGINRSPRLADRIKKTATIRIPEQIHSQRLYEWGIPKEWEGIVIKTKEYYDKFGLVRFPPRWIKFKHSFHVPCYVIAHEPTKSLKHGAFLLATEEGGPLRYVGKVGTGFTAGERVKLAKLVDAKAYPSVLVRTAGWTKNGRLREPVFVPGSIRPIG